MLCSTIQQFPLPKPRNCGLRGSLLCNFKQNLLGDHDSAVSAPETSKLRSPGLSPLYFQAKAGGRPRFSSFRSSVISNKTCWETTIQQFPLPKPRNCGLPASLLCILKQKLVGDHDSAVSTPETSKLRFFGLLLVFAISILLGNNIKGKTTMQQMQSPGLEPMAIL